MKGGLPGKVLGLRWMGGSGGSKGDGQVPKNAPPPSGTAPCQTGGFGAETWAGGGGWRGWNGTEQDLGRFVPYGQRAEPVG